jgi:hypothetical protein
MFHQLCVSKVYYQVYSQTFCFGSGYVASAVAWVCGDYGKRAGFFNDFSQAGTLGFQTFRQLQQNTFCAEFGYFLFYSLFFKIESFHTHTPVEEIMKK